MTSEYGNSDRSVASDALEAGRRGLSRRQMIKASAVAGAAAWTAPMIIDSLASPAAAVSGACTPYWIKILGTSTTISFNCPGSNTFDVCDAYWGNNSDPPTNFVGGGGCPPTTPVWCGKPNDAISTANVPTGNVLDGNNYRKVTLPSNCKFDSTLSWQIGGRYSNSYLKATATGASAPASGNGCYTDGGQTAWISRYLTPGNNATTPIDYVYLKYCCTSAPSTTTTSGGGHDD